MSDDSNLNDMLAAARQAYEAGDPAAAAQSFRATAAAARAQGNEHLTAIALANLGAALGAAGDLPGAQQALQDSAVASRAMGDLDGECRASISLARVFARMEQHEQARQTWQVALELARRMLNGELAALATDGLAEALRKLGQRDEARALLEKLLAYQQKQRDQKEQIEVHISLAGLELDAGETRPAEIHGQRALVLSRQLGDRSSEAYCLYKLGSLYHHTGFNLEAQDMLQQAVVLYRSLGERQRLGLTINELAMVRVHLGQYEQALTLHQEALQIALEGGRLTDQGAVLHGIGYIYQQLGRLEEALSYYQRALKVTEQAGDWRSAALTLTNLGVITAESGNYDEAKPLIQQAYFLQQKGGDKLAAGHTLVSLAALQAHEGEHEAALATLEQALGVQQETGDRNSQAATHATMGEVLISLARFAEALAHKEQALALFRQVSNPVGQIQVLYGMARLHARTGALAKAEQVLEAAVAQIEGLRLNLVSEELRTSYFAHMQNIYALYVEVLLAMERQADAFFMVERSKARAFLDLLTEAQSAFRADLDPALQEEEVRLLEELDALGKQTAALPAGEDARRAELEAQRQEVERRYQLLQGRIHTASPRYSALTQPALWDIEQVQRGLLDEHTALLEYILGEGASTLFVVLHDDFQVFRLPPRAEIETRVRELRASLTLHRYLHGEELYRQLIAPAAALLQGKDLLIVADGVLHYLPFALLLTRPPEGEGTGGTEGAAPAALRSAGAFSVDAALTGRLAAQLDPLPPFDFPNLPYLIRRHAVRYAPSASAAGMMAAGRALGGGATGAGLQIAALGDPRLPVQMALPAAAQGALRTGLDPLPCTAEEVWALAGLFEPRLPAERLESFTSEHVLLYTGDRATKAQMLALTDGSQAYRFLHLATHGLLNIEKPQFSGLLFSSTDGADAYWQTFEIFQAHIPAETVVLSACETGLGKVIRGEGLVGLARAFLYAGAQRVCVSLWKVADESTPPLMQAFYAAMQQGEAPARAMQQAQRTLLEQGTYSHPYFWAPFVLLGD